MLKSISLFFFMMFAFSLLVAQVVLAQSPSPTASPTASSSPSTTMPAGAPNTGRG